MENLKRLISNHEKTVEKTKKLRLGMLLVSASRTSLKGVITSRKPFTVGQFEISFSAHGTGIDVKVWVVKGEDKLVILDGTYWYNESVYGFNKFIIINGAWDASFNIEIEKIRSNLIEFLNKEHKSLLAKMLAEKQAEVAFNTSPTYFVPNNPSTIFQHQNDVWLEVSSEGVVELFDEELMDKQAKEGCAYAKAIKAFKKYLDKQPDIICF